MKTPFVPLYWSGLASALLLPHALAQTTYSWRAEATNGTWELADNWWDGVQTAIPGGTEILSFDNDAQPVMTNDLAATTRHRILFNATTTVSRSVTGATQNLFASSGANPPLIQNSSAVLHSLSFPILLDPTSLTVDAASGPLALGGAISGSGGILKTGANILTLGGANVFTGKTSVSAGTVSIDADSRLGAAPGAAVADQLSLDNGSLRVTGVATVTLSTNRGITLGASGGTLDNAAMAQSLNANFNPIIAGNGPLTLRANGNTSDTGGGVGGNLTLGNAANTFTGDVTIQSGVVNFVGDVSFGAAANDIILAGGGLVATGPRTFPATRDIVLSGGGDRIFRVYGNQTFTINGAITGVGNVRHTDGGTLQLNGNNSFTGNLLAAAPGRIIALGGTNTYSGYTHLFNSSTIRLDANNALPDTTGVLLYGGTTLNVNGRTDTVRGVFVGSAGDTTATVNLGLSGSTGTLTVTNNSMVVGAPTNIGGNFYGKFAGFGSVEYNNSTSDTALWDWYNTTNDFTGNVVITRGRLRSVLNGGLGSFGAATNDLVFNGDVVSTLGNGQGKASLQGAASGALDLGIDRSVILNSGKEGTMYVWSGNTYTVNGQITGGGNLRKEDGGVLLLNNTANNYTGLTRIAQGSIRLAVADVLPDATSVEIAGGNLDLNAISESVASLFGTGGAVNGGGTLTVLTSGSANYSGSIQGGSTVRMAGTGTQTLSGTGDNVNGWASVDSGTLVLAKTSTAAVHAIGRINAVGLAITGGTARLAGTGNDQIYTEVHVNQTGGVFDLNGTSEGFRGLTGTGGTVRNDLAATASALTLGETSLIAESYTYSGVIADGAGTTSLTKVGAGTQTLAGTNTYTGTTTINAGRLLINGSVTASPITVASGTGALGGTGSVDTPVTVVHPGTIAPGSTVGTLTVAACDLDGILEIDLNGASADRLDVTGELDITSADVAFKTPGGGATQPVYIIASYGTLVGTEFFTEVDLPLGYAIDYNYQNNKQIAIVSSGTPFSLWAADKGLTSGNNQPGDDPDKDGATNLAEFAFDDEPLSGASSGKIVGKIETVSGNSYLTLTLPVRNGAVFSGPGDLVSAPVAGVTYTIQGSTDLAAFTSMNLVEVTPAITAGLPLPLSNGWSYRTFRTPDPTGSLARQFLRAVAE